MKFLTTLLVATSALAALPVTTAHTYTCTDIVSKDNYVAGNEKRCRGLVNAWFSKCYGHGGDGCIELKGQAVTIVLSPLPLGCGWLPIVNIVRGLDRHWDNVRPCVTQIPVYRN
ncbi:hypothetical protein K432DRAFT_409713 [Lepidopterella palustris CBS 459.81]|uniref:Uncharacterized protein n=1 Tax=Lepidopterella palustris CBS 459.81 TaxID=1314670 RepID=A0A8E2DZZ5_9PEZI|nr:hypothetical protein K432DRAFT_409713 [Lepidopterella palustris CBS 459.81]